jgi:flagellar basal body-associated protein FliL
VQKRSWMRCLWLSCGAVLWGHLPPARAEEPRPVPIEQLAINQEEAAEQALRMDSAPTEAASPSPSALQIELSQILAAEADALSELEVALRAADQQTARALEQRIALVKRDTEIALLRSQQRHALSMGAHEQADDIEAAIQQMLHPPATRVESDRIAPESQR